MSRPTRRQPAIALLTLSPRTRALALLVLAGEVVFFLPFVLPRVFRPTLLGALGISNLELGTYFSAYGLVAVGAYFLGGPLADRYPPHRLMAVALATTGAGGLYLATLPPSGGMLALYAAWGLTTILLFWAAMLRATRVVGGVGRQGLAFGALEGGRGAVAAVIATAGVQVLAVAFPLDAVDADQAAQQAGLRAVALAFTAVVLVVASLVWWGLRGLSGDADESAAPTERPWRGLAAAARRPQVWLLAVIILCAYSGYRVLDDVSLLASEVLGYGDVAAARLGSLSLLLRPVAAVAAGLAADRLSASRASLVAFALMLVGGAAMAAGPLGAAATWTVLAAVVLSCLGVYALRGLYFALVDEGRTPLAATGATIGLASVVGYLPDVYMGPLMGWLLDGWPGAKGHRLVFALAIGFAAVGALAVWAFRRSVGRG